MSLLEMAELAAKSELTIEDVEKFCQKENINTLQLYDDLAKYIAEGYAARKFNFEFCDIVLNQIWGISNWNFPTYCYSIFQAFERSEIYTPEEFDKSKPDEFFTRPLIEAILAKEVH